MNDICLYAQAPTANDIGLWDSALCGALAALDRLLALRGIGR